MEKPTSEILKIVTGQDNTNDFGIALTHLSRLNILVKSYGHKYLSLYFPDRNYTVNDIMNIIQCFSNLKPKSGYFWTENLGMDDEYRMFF